MTWREPNKTFPNSIRAGFAANIENSSTPRHVRVLTKENQLQLEYADELGLVNLPAELLRVYSKAANAASHMIKKSDANSGSQAPPAGKSAVKIYNAKMVGSYGLQIFFDDLHQEGIYSWDYLRGLSENKRKYMKEYIHALRMHDLSRHVRKRRKAAAAATPAIKQ